MSDLRTVAWITLTGAWAACVAASPAVTPVPLGTWGGRGIDVVVGEQSTRLEFDCAHGEIAGRLEIPKSGEADTTGWMVLEGGPTREEAARVEARFRLRLEGTKLLLAVVSQGSDSTHRYEAVRGKPPVLRKCG